MPKLMAKTSLAIAGCAVIALSMAACSSGAGSSAGSQAASNSPVTIMVAGQLQAASFQFPDMAVGAEAAAAKINASGGINGHRVRIIQCNDGGDTAKATQCGLQAVSAHVIAVVGFSLAAPTLLNIFRANKVAWLNDAISPQEMTYDNSFPLDTPSALFFGAAAQYMTTRGCKVVGISYLGSAALSAATVATTGAALDGAKSVRADLDPTQADYSPNVSSLLARGADCLDPALGNLTMPRYMTAVRSLAPKISIAGPDNLVAADVLSQLGTSVNGMRVFSNAPPFDSTDPATRAFVAAMRKQDSSVAITDKGLMTWNAVQIVAQAAAANRALPVTAANILADLSKLKNARLNDGLTLNFTTPGPLKTAPRAFNTEAYASTLMNGKHIGISAPIDLGTTFADVKLFS
jgi:branched-chain amino acid transport system substrate-binding protein